MQLDDQIGVRIEAPGEIGREERRDLSRCPPEKMTVRIRRGPENQTVVARLRILFVETARRRCPVDPDVGMMDHPGITWPELQTSDVARSRGRDRHDEDSEDVRAVGFERVRHRRRQHQIGLAKLPPFGPMRGRRKIVGVALDGAFVHPPLKPRNLFVRERTLPDELAVSGLNLPRRHEPGPCDGRDLLRVLPHVGVGEQLERSRTARVVAHHAAIEDQGRDVFAEGDAVDWLCPFVVRGIRLQADRSHHLVRGVRL